jgi:hypothetical protein
MATFCSSAVLVDALTEISQSMAEHKNSLGRSGGSEQAKSKGRTVASESRVLRKS